MVFMRSRRASPQTAAVLCALRHLDDWSYGYELSSSTGLRSGTLYPILARLADRGMLESRWESESVESRPRRHLYRLTAAGANAASACGVSKGHRPQYALRPNPQAGA